MDAFDVQKRSMDHLDGSPRWITSRDAPIAAESRLIRSSEKTVLQALPLVTQMFLLGQFHELYSMKNGRSEARNLPKFGASLS